MRISELSAATGVSIASLKFYLREGLLHPGESLGPTRADYDDSHLERIRLVRTLVDVGRLSIERVREVVRALENPPASRHALLATAHHVLREDSGPVHASERARGLMAGIDVEPNPDPDPDPDPDPADEPPDREGSAAADALERALAAAEAGGWTVRVEALEVWSKAMRSVAEVDVVPELAALSPAEALRYVVVGNVLTDPVLIALRRVEQERLSAERLDDSPPPHTPR